MFSVLLNNYLNTKLVTNNTLRKKNNLSIESKDTYIRTNYPACLYYYINKNNEKPLKCTNHT